MSYNELIRRSVEELSALTMTNVGKWTELQSQSAREVMVSLEKTLAAHALGKQNEDYTKKDTYISIGNGISLNATDNTLQLFGLSYTIWVFKKINPSPLTLAKNEIRNQLSLNKFREFALDASQIESINFGN